MIRIATEADLPAIVAIYNAAVPGRLATADTEPVSVGSRREWFAEHTPDRHPLWVDERDGEVAGWLSLGRFYNRPAWDITAEVSVYVAPAHRRQGVATALLDTAIVEAPGLGLRVLIGIIFGHNEPSLALFRRSGFEQWAFMPRVTDLDDVERNVVFMGRRVDERQRCTAGILPGTLTNDEVRRSRYGEGDVSGTCWTLRERPGDDA